VDSSNCESKICARQWRSRNDGVAAASRDGGPTGKGPPPPDSSRVLNDEFLMFVFVVIE